MKQPMDDKQMSCYLSAFADGELEIERSLQVLQRMAMDPQMTRRVMHQQQLRRLTAQAMAEPTHCPEELRRRLTELARTAPAATEEAGPRPVLARIGRWVPTAMAAALLLMALIVFDAGRPGGGTFIGTFASHTSDLLPPAEIQRFSRRHVQCSRGVEQLMNTTRFPTEVEVLPRALESYFGHTAFDVPPLDLSVLGYRYVNTGECIIPGSGAVHVLYRAAPETGRNDALSLWIRPYDGSVIKLKEGQLYTAAGGTAAHPLLIWRRGDLAYFLSGDSIDTVEQVAMRLNTRG